MDGLVKKDKILELAKQRFQDAEDGWNENREAALDDIRFARLGEQWPEDMKTKRENEGRPCLTINRLPSFIRQVVNDARLNTPSIKVHPVDDNADPETAEVLDGVIRNIEATSNAEQCYDTALESAVTSGFGFFRIDMDYSINDTFEMDLKIERIANPLSVYPDPHSTATDASDWMYCFIIDTLSKDEFKASYPNADCSDWDGSESNGWVTDDSVRVAEYWERKEIDVVLLLLSDGTVINQDKYIENQQLFDVAQTTIVQQRPSKSYKVIQRIMTSSDVLEETEWPGIYIPVVPVYGDEIVEEDKRHFQSLVRQSKDAQRNYNYWRTASTEKVALATKAPWIGPTGAFDTDVRKWESANTETHPFIEYDGNIPPSSTPPSMADAGSITEALNASDDLKNVMGLQDASLGRASNETSGKAILARQREGDVSTYHFIDNLSRGIQYAGKVLLDLIPHVYNKPRIMRIMGMDGSPDSVQINKEFDVNGISKLHDLTKGKYDLVVKAGPSFTTQREESAAQMTELLRTFPQAAPLIGDLVATALDWPGADEIAKRLKTLLPPEIQAMEKMDGLPPEAQSAIAQAQQQVKQLTDVIQKGKQMLTEKDEQIKGLEIEKKSKDDENQIKAIDSERKYNADMAKIDADMKIVAHKENEENRRAIIGEATGFLREYIDKTAVQQNESIDTQQTEHKESLANIMQGFEVFNQAIQQINEKLDELSNPTKTIEIEAPSGGTYQGVVDGEDIQIKAPSGAIYSGKVTVQ